jgi:hypothetical protein
MGCRHELSLDFLAEVTPKNFHNKEYRLHRTNIAMTLEKSLLPATQPLAEQAKERFEFEQLITQMRSEHRRHQREGRQMWDRIQRLTWENHWRGEVNIPTEIVRKNQFNVKCPIDECRGYLSTAWKCGLCHTFVCSKCRIPKESRDDDEHKCNADDVASFELMKKDTKPCPKCAVPIFKISGCDQMFCIECQTPWSWRTGSIITGAIHNPHYFEWQRDMNNGVVRRQPGDVRCGGLPTWIEISDKLNYDAIDQYGNAYRLPAHIRDVTLRNFPDDANMDDNTDIRVEYLIGAITEKKWKSKLQMRMKKNEKNHEVHQVFYMVAETLDDIWIRFGLDEINTADLIFSLEKLKTYVNGQLAIIRKRFDNRVPHITDRWTISGEQRHPWGYRY